MLSTNWRTRGCLAGRGVLIDFKLYAEVKGISYFLCINFTDIENAAKYQGVTFKPGDILIICWGYMEALGKMKGEE